MTIRQKLPGAALSHPFLIALGLALSACETTTVETIGICNSTSPALLTCEEYTSGFTAQTAQINCAALGFSYSSSSSTCSRTSATGICRITTTADNSIRTLIYYAPDFATSEAAQRQCDSLPASGLVTVSFSTP